MTAIPIESPSSLPRRGAGEVYVTHDTTGLLEADNGLEVDVVVFSTGVRPQDTLGRYGDLASIGANVSDTKRLEAAAASLKEDAALNPLDQATLYGGGPAGYTDYPTLD